MNARRRGAPEQLLEAHAVGVGVGRVDDERVDLLLGLLLLLERRHEGGELTEVGIACSHLEWREGRARSGCWWWLEWRRARGEWLAQL